MAKELNGYVVSTVTDPVDPTKIVLERGKQVDTFGQLRDDGSTASGCWISAGCWTERGNMMARRDTSDPGNTGAYANWAFSWPANRRILYNRARPISTARPGIPSAS
jgi:formate dehydrogenase major subunit